MGREGEGLYIVHGLVDKGTLLHKMVWDEINGGTKRKIKISMGFSMIYDR